MQLAEVMTCDVDVLDPEETLDVAAERMQGRNVGFLPVCADERLVGVLTARDVTVRATAQGRGPRTTLVREVMTPAAVVCFADQEVREALHVMQAQQVRRVPVLNRAQQLVGVVARADLVDLVAAAPGTLPPALRELVSGPTPTKDRAAAHDIF